MKIHEILESSGYIPKNEKEAKDPRWIMSQTCDVGPEEGKKQAKKLNFELDDRGMPPIMGSNGLLK
jgi:hypothetical protein